MSDLLTRRQFLRAAGGVTFLALTPTGTGLFAAPVLGKDAPALPFFTVLPYIQPGAASALAAEQESLVVAWQTQNRPADFAVDFGPSKSYGNTAKIASSPRFSGDTDDGEPRLNYTAILTGMSLHKTYYYRVRGNGQILAEGYFQTRKPRGAATRFVTFGDNSFGDVSDRAIAYQTYKARPDFVMNTGDNVYDDGLENEYNRYFFPVYNNSESGPTVGAPLLRSVPFYTVIANHDVHQKDALNHPVADFAKNPDSLAYYTAMSLPLNGPEPSQVSPMVGPDTLLAAFRRTAGPRFPRQANYSFDYADAHFLCLDSNVYVDPTDAALQAWIEKDLAGTDAVWKFVVYHHPAFNVGAEHYQEQHMRVLAPLFEKHGVDIALHGHEHTYQRTKPLKFAPTGASKAAAVNTKDRRVPGVFSLDEVFDGKTHTKPNGVIYITTGAGGKHLYDVDYTGDPAKWVHPDDGNTPYVANFISDRHSLTVIELDGGKLMMTQIDENGQEVDRMTITKS